VAKLGSRETQRAEDQLATLAKEVDDRKEITWYSDRSSTALILGPYAKAYFGRKEDWTMPLRLKVQTEGDGTTFAWVLEVEADGAAFPLPTEPNEWMSDHGSGKVWVQADVPISTRCPGLTRALASAAEARIRFEGGRPAWVWTLPGAQLAALKRVHDAWSALVATVPPGGRSGPGRV